MNGALTDLLARALGAPAHSVESVDGEAMAPAELLALAGRIGNELTTKGVAPDEPVLLRMANRPSDIGALLGVWRAGAVAVPLHMAAAPSTVARVQGLTGARFAVDGGRVDVVGQASPPQRPLLRDAALVIFTSGSTGMPKGVVLAHARFAAKLAVLDRLLGITADDCVLLPLQLNFVFGLWAALLALMKNARLLLAARPDGAAFRASLAQASVLGGVPTMYRALLAENAPAAPKLRLIMTGGEVLSRKLADAIRRCTPAALYDLYGLTETGACDFCLGPADQPQGFGSIGRPTERIDFRIAPSGELQIRTPFGLIGYLDDPQLTAAALEDGYFKSGDLARMNSRGLVELVGRAKDIVSRGGIKIAPLEVDHLLAEHPDVAAALCAGVPDERLGEVLHAVVVPREGRTLDAAKLREWLIARTERFKVPEVIYIRAALPSGATGKADRRAVARLAEG